MNRKSLVTALAILMIPVAVYGQDRSVQQIVAEIKQMQGAETAEDIELDGVSDDTLEELGEALMSIMVPNERQHEYMDRMMGGEGSDSLEAMHRSIGYSYLAGTLSESWGRPWGGMMAPGRAWGPGMMDGRGVWSSMHGSTASGGWVWIIVAILAVALIVLITVLILRSRRHPSRGRVSGGAREIFAERYARGEISRDEYRRALDDLD